MKNWLFELGIHCLLKGKMHFRQLSHYTNYGLATDTMELDNLQTTLTTVNRTSDLQTCANECGGPSHDGQDIRPERPSRNLREMPRGTY